MGAGERFDALLALVRTAVLGATVAITCGVAVRVLVTTLPRLDEERRAANGTPAVFEPRESRDCDAELRHCLTTGDVVLNGTVVMTDVTLRDVIPLGRPIGRVPTPVTLVRHGELYDVYGLHAQDRYDDDREAVRLAGLYLGAWTAFGLLLAYLAFREAR
jgi:hypothetical protein